MILHRLVAALLLVPLLAATAAGQGGIQNLLAPLDEHPAVVASRMALRAAQAQYQAAGSPVQLGIEGGYSVLDADDVDIAPTVPGSQGLDETAASLSADLTLRPFAFGDVADMVDQRRIALEQARLDYFETLTTLQTQALQAAQGVTVAQRGLEAAIEGQSMAAEALEATRIRLERGAASERELRDALAGRQEAGYRVESARERLESARNSLRSLVGETAVPPDLALELPEPGAVPLQLARARLQVRLAEIAPRSAQRSLIPTVQASYTWNLSEHDSLSVSLESRTLQPRVGYSYQSPGRTFPQTAIDGSFQVGVSLTISPAGLDALEAARLQSEAAEQGFEATRRAAELQLAGLRNALQGARRAVDIAETRLQNSRLELEETRQRQRAGLAIPLEVLQASLAVTSADLELQAARQDLQVRIHDLYEFYGQPPYLHNDTEHNDSEHNYTDHNDTEARR